MIQCIFIVLVDVELAAVESECENDTDDKPVGLSPEPELKQSEDETSPICK